MNQKIIFNKPPFLGVEVDYISKAIANGKLSGDGEYTAQCNRLLEEKVGCTKALLTTSCTHALEMAALLCNVNEGDEVIMPSYTFVSTANAFVLRGAKIVFVDIRPDTMNIDEKLIEEAITKRTKAIVPVHYAGVACEMDTINHLAKEYRLFVIEDAAQAIDSTYKGRQCGALGDFGCFSFHETKNISCGEGGALTIINNKYSERAEILREKGTNRSKYFRGEIDKYTWVDQGSSYLPSELNAAYLLAQLELSDRILKDRVESWKFYDNELSSLIDLELIKTPYLPPECEHNGHMYYIKTRDLEERTKLIAYLREKEIYAVFHYVPLHSSEAGLRYSTFIGEDRYTTKESERLLRLPLYYGMSTDEKMRIVEAIKSFYKRK